MVLNKFQEQIENMETSEILGSNYGCKKCSTNKVSIIKSSKIKKTKSSKKTKLPREIKKRKSSLVNKILLILIITILIFAFTFNIGTLDYFNLNMFNDKINGIKYFILSKINFYSNPEINS